MKNHKWAVGIDLGGTKINVAEIDSSGKIIEKQRLSTDVQGGPEAIINQIIDAVKKLEKIENSTPVGIGIGVPGQVDNVTGSVHFAPNLFWYNVPIRKELEKALNLPVVVTNDVRAATWGEWVHGAGKGCKDMICLFMGTGIGGGIVSGGHMLQGTSNSAGELGHMTIDLNGPSCTCGNWGCMEAFAAGWAIARQAEKAMIANPEEGNFLEKLVEEKGEAINAKIVFEAYRKGDPLATKIVNNVIQAVIAGCIGIVNAFNPQKLIMGGGLLDGLPELTELVGQGIRERALSIASEPLQVVHSHLKNDAGVIGAGVLAFHTFE